MDEILEKNLQALRDYRDDLYRIIMSEGALDSEYSKGVASSSEMVDGKLILFAVRDEQLFLLDSAGSSDDLIASWESGFSAFPDSKYLILGFGNGTIIRRTLGKMYNKGSLLVYEPDMKLFTHVIENYDVSDVLKDERLTIICPHIETDQEKDLFHTCGELLEYTDIDALVVTDHPNYRNIYPSAWEYFKGTADNVISSMVANRTVMSRFGKAFVENTLANISCFRESRSALSLMGKIPDTVPVIIVASGPSLNKNIEELKRAKGHAFIIAADSAVSVLLKAGIRPDMFFCVDAKKNEGHFAYDEVKELPIGCELDTTRVAFKDRKGLCFFLRNNNPHINEFLDENSVDMIELDSGGSVANVATDFALQLGAKRIILVGQDLAYTGDKSHASGSLRADWNLDLSINECFVEGQDGKQIRSSAEFVKYREVFERMIARSGEVDFINSTEGGAKINGTRQIPLKESVSEYCRDTFDPEAFLQGSENLFTDKQRELFDEYMARLNSQVESLAVQINTGYRSYSEMYKLAAENKHTNSRFKKLYEKTREVGQLLNTSGAMYYIENMVQEEMTSLMDRQGKQAASEKSQMLADIKSGMDYFELVGRGIKELNVLMESNYTNQRK